VGELRVETPKQFAKKKLITDVGPKKWAGKGTARETR